ncbi:uncharacterized protein B0H18DRAFT_974352 [Fomitopsis serialis]|uniref:uncharacterized protein n=1 Tax=Fomitopsis serialis TaxID=139415 RepID=UPI00200767E6|nr:uncharacterized protein B0H18DRAFT_974352 [Neoantrodia serialis]KAH9936548.1 hypothetical protein B0H18DRAFT_974352 [Neoantrodia serialis]
MATPEHPESRPQAGPLPAKRGEIGYEDGVHGPAQQEQAGEGSGTAEVSTPLPERHPADTPLPSATPQPDPSTPTASTHNASSAESPSTANPPNTSAPLNPSDSTGRKLTSFLSCKRIPTFRGMRATTLSLFVFQLGVLSGTIAGWIVLVQRMQAAQTSDQRSGQDSSGGMSMGSALIFVYVAFAMLTLLQVVFLERCIFRLRAERYGSMHPGEILPTHRNRGQPRHPGIAFAPWNRPPLPTYAATLAQSGVGTGDVEDNIIAQAPPPAYGEHRSSQLLLRGEIPEQLREERLPESGSVRSSIMSWLNIRRISVRSTGSSGPRIEPDPGERDRPKSYMSTDPEWEEALDANRAATLEETLSKLEEGDGAGDGAESRTTAGDGAG